MSKKTHGGCLLGSALLVLTLLPFKKEETENKLKLHALLYDYTYRKDEDEHYIDLFSKQSEQFRIVKEAICDWLSE